MKVLPARFVVPWLLLAADGARGAEVPAPGLVPGTGGVVEMLGGLAVVIAAVLVLAWLVRRVGRINARVGGALRLVGGLSVGTRERVLLVQAGDTQILIGVAPGRVQTLHVLARPIETAPAEEGAFAARLRAALGTRGGDGD